MHLQERGVEKWQPPCWTKKCNTSTANYEGLEEWIKFLYLILQASNIAPSTVSTLLEQADANDPETLEIVILMANKLRAG